MEGIPTFHLSNSYRVGSWKAGSWQGVRRGIGRKLEGIAPRQRQRIRQEEKSRTVVRLSLAEALNYAN
jgi:hypothetical protein